MKSLVSLIPSTNTYLDYDILNFGLPCNLMIVTPCKLVILFFLSEIYYLFFSCLSLLGKV